MTVMSILMLFAVSSFAQKTKGYQGIIEVGGGVCVFDVVTSQLKADFINGYKFNNQFSMGLGLGIRKFSPDFVPLVYLNFRRNLGYDKFEKVYPYIQTGIGFPVLNQSVGLAFKNVPIAIGLHGEVIPLFGAIFISVGANIGILF